VLLGEQPPGLEPTDLILELFELVAGLGGRTLVFELLCELDQRRDVVARAGERIEVADDPLDDTLLFEDALRCGVVLPEGGQGGLPVEVLDAQALALDVKDAPRARRRARRPVVGRSRSRRTWQASGGAGG